MIRALVLILALGSCSSCAGNAVHMHKADALSINGDVLAFLASIHEQFRLETVLCLTGHVYGGKLYVEDVRLAGVSRATESSADFDNCRQPGTIGYAHNHPNGSCLFSDTDLKSMRTQGARLILASCARGFIWRTPSNSGLIPWHFAERAP
jgi:hypothetical protein